MSAVETTKKSATSTRGFASMDPEKQRAIARKGGESVPHEKRSFSQNPGLAAEAGRKGGQSVNPNKRSFSRNHALASEAGRKGGHASHGGPKKRSPTEADVAEHCKSPLISGFFGERGSGQFAAAFFCNFPQKPPGLKLRTFSGWLKTFMLRGETPLGGSATGPMRRAISRPA